MVQNSHFPLTTITFILPCFCIKWYNFFANMYLSYEREFSFHLTSHKTYIGTHAIPFDSSWQGLFSWHK